MKASKFEKAFDDGKNVMAALDVSMARRVNQRPKRVNVDFPEWMVHSLDQEARRLGVTRQSVIKVWISECLKRKLE